VYALSLQCFVLHGHHQVTRLLCGGFVFALRFKHAMCDGVGIGQFISAVSELARGLPAPAVLPVWSRELLQARNPPKAPAFPHPEYTVVRTPPPPSGYGDMVSRTFTFGPSEIAAIKTRLPPQLCGRATTFEALTAALEFPPEEQLRLGIIYNVRGVRELWLPAGYYGNAVVASTVLTTAGELLGRPLGDAVEQIQEAKAVVTAEYVRPTLDLLVLHGRRSLVMSMEDFAVSDIRHAGYLGVDFGWGEPVYGSRADARPGMGFLITVKNESGLSDNAAAASHGSVRVGAADAAACRLGFAANSTSETLKFASFSRYVLFLTLVATASFLIKPIRQVTFRKCRIVSIQCTIRQLLVCNQAHS
jgi:benzyl alcohol O-benzoyltransferase